MSAAAIRQADNSVEIALRVHPRARRAGITGIHDNRIKLAVNAPPEDGQANRAIVKLIAATLGVASRQVEIIRGATSRSKDVRVTGVTLAEAVERLLP